MDVVGVRVVCGRLTSFEQIIDVRSWPFAAHKIRKYRGFLSVRSWTEATFSLI